MGDIIGPILLVFIFVGFLGCIFYIAIEVRRRKIEIRREEEASVYTEECSRQAQMEISNHNTLVKTLSDKYGESQNEVCLCIPSTEYCNPDQKHYYYINVFEKSKVILFDEKIYDFKEVLGYTIKDNSTELTITTTTGDSSSSAADVIGRSLIGGAIGGEAGAIIGGATVGRNIATMSTSRTNKREEYAIYINLNNFSTPIIKVETYDIDELQKLASILNIIISRNNIK